MGCCWKWARVRASSTWRACRQRPGWRGGRGEGWEDACARAWVWCGHRTPARPPAPCAMLAPPPHRGWLRGRSPALNQFLLALCDWQVRLRQQRIHRRQTGGWRSVGPLGRGEGQHGSPPRGAANRYWWRGRRGARLPAPVLASSGNAGPAAPGSAEAPACHCCGRYRCILIHEHQRAALLTAQWGRRPIDAVWRACRFSYLPAKQAARPDRGPAATVELLATC
jgi:hypothetical protein